MLKLAFIILYLLSENYWYIYHILKDFHVLFQFCFIGVVTFTSLPACNMLGINDDIMACACYCNNLPFDRIVALSLSQKLG